MKKQNLTTRILTRAANALRMVGTIGFVMVPGVGGAGMAMGLYGLVTGLGYAQMIGGVLLRATPFIAISSIFSLCGPMALVFLGEVCASLPRS